MDQFVVFLCKIGLHAFFPEYSLNFIRSQSNRYYWKGKEWIAFIQKEKIDGETHDMGFKMYCSYGEIVKITGAPEYKDILLTSAETLSKRFDPKVGSIRSWDFGEWQFPVIIDNMMNLELLFEATQLTGDSTYHQIAETQAYTTMKNYFRDDFSSYLVVDYDKMTGEVL